jgi:cobyrinic acid a,c-diamide synthase
MHIPRIVVAGTHSGVGKTTVATALMAALARRGLRVQPFKVGPDFIDPGFHQAACGRLGRNLDGWMLKRDTNLEIFTRACRDADIAVIEGVMGLFDGRGAGEEAGSTAEMAKWLGAPVLLVVDASAMARSAAALVRGFETFDPELDLAGILFNRVGGLRHRELLEDSLRAYCRTTPVGFLARGQEITLPDRHLGLVLAEECFSDELLSRLVSWIENHLDLDAILRLAKERAADLPAAAESLFDAGASSVRIAVARDAAFCFYYADNLDLLRASGAELVPFSPIADSELPVGVHGLYLGGGYPELHAARLAANQPMISDIRRFVAAGAPVYAECGGFMYLMESIVDAEGREFPMAGVFPTRARMQKKFAAMGYREVTPIPGVGWIDEPCAARGHEFRYSEMDPMPAGVRRAYQEPAPGYRIGSALGSYVHLHFASCPAFARAFVAQCAAWRQGTACRSNP